LIPGWSALRSLDVSAVSPAAWGLGAFIVVFPTAAAYFMTVWALARVESSVVALFIYLQPVIATGLSIALLGDRIAPREALGAALVFVSVYFTLRPPGRRPGRPGPRLDPYFSHDET
jgi:drug/metabolite transporter (DMT)-like permease